MRGSRKLKLSLIVALALGFAGCGSSSNGGEDAVDTVVETPALIPTDITVERGAVYGAIVSDANGTLAIQKVGENIYTFGDTPSYPVTVNGGWIDLDGDGVQTVADMKLTLEMKSYSTNITPITTYLAEGDEISRANKLKALSDETGISEDELLQLPSLASADSIAANNAVFKQIKLQGDDISKVKLNNIKAEFDTLKVIAESSHKTGSDLAQFIEDTVITDLATQDKVALITTLGDQSGKLVDPYISGALLCEDINNNSTCDLGEQTSTTTSLDGDFTFKDPLTPGVNIIIKAQGMHLGKTYDLDISGVVATDGSIDIISPLTTLESKELTGEQIAAILNKGAQNAGLTGWNISADDVSGDPLSNNLLNKYASDITDTDLINIQASLATYGLLRIIKGSDKLSKLTANELYISGMGIDNEGAIGEILTSMLVGVSNSLNTEMLVEIKTDISQAKDTAQNTIDTFTASMPKSVPISNSYGTVNIEQAIADATEQAIADATDTTEAISISDELTNIMPNIDNILNEPTVEDIIHVGVVIIDRISEVGYNKCNETGGDYEAALVDANAIKNIIVTNANIIAIGEKLYGMKHSGSLKEYKSYIPSSHSNLLSGINDAQNGKVTYRFNSNNELISQ